MSQPLPQFVEFVIDQLDGVDDVRAKRMFSGHGLYAGEWFFAIIHDGQLYFKTDADSRQAYIARGEEPFTPPSGRTLTAYYAVPEDVVEDPAALVQWARRAIAVAVAAQGG